MTLPKLKSQNILLLLWSSFIYDHTKKFMTSAMILDPRAEWFICEHWLNHLVASPPSQSATAVAGWHYIWRINRIKASVGITQWLGDSPFPWSLEISKVEFFPILPPPHALKGFTHFWTHCCNLCSNFFPFCTPSWVVIIITCEMYFIYPTLYSLNAITCYYQ